MKYEEFYTDHMAEDDARLLYGDATVDNLLFLNCGFTGGPEDNSAVEKMIATGPVLGKVVVDEMLLTSVMITYLVSKADLAKCKDDLSNCSFDNFYFTLDDAGSID